MSVASRNPRPRSATGRRAALLVIAVLALGSTAVAIAGSAAPQRKAATQLSATSRCAGTPPRAVASLRWKPSRAGRQRVDVTVLEDGFSKRAYDSSSRFSRTRHALTWRRVSGEATHYWRVLTAVNHRWYRSATGTFPGPGCVGADLQPQRR